jgi:hypothetical protein
MLHIKYIFQTYCLDAHMIRLKDNKYAGKMLHTHRPIEIQK